MRRREHIPCLDRAREIATFFELATGPASLAAVSAG